MANPVTLATPSATRSAVTTLKVSVKLGCNPKSMWRAVWRKLGHDSQSFSINFAHFRPANISRRLRVVPWGPSIRFPLIQNSKSILMLDAISRAAAPAERMFFKRRWAPKHPILTVSPENGGRVAGAVPSR